MANNWSSDNFVIPDEEEDQWEPQMTVEDTPAPEPPQASNSTSSYGWTPKIDLSSAFSPFTSSKNFKQKNQIKERQYTGGDTLDEPVWQTLKRDLLLLGKRVIIVIWPMQLSKLANKQQQRLLEMARTNGVDFGTAHRVTSVPEFDEEDATAISSDAEIGGLDWDLWGPLVFSLIYSSVLGFSAPNEQTNKVFSGSFSFIWLFSMAIGLNIQLLGGSISFMSAMSATGYSMFPIVLGEVICALVLSWRPLRLLIMIILSSWSVYAATLSLKCSGVLPGRVFLAMYPVGLMYTVLAWLTVIT